MGFRKPAALGPEIRLWLNHVALWHLSLWEMWLEAPSRGPAVPAGACQSNADLTMGTPVPMTRGARPKAWTKAASLISEIKVA